MGWLDNSTNNIILDAVLTDYGRQALAKNDGSFRIAKFALGDDEVNYGIIAKYGRTVGREKIEKNTPIFEAFTNQNLALKYKLVSVPRPLLYLPSLNLSIAGKNSVSLSTVGGGTNTSSITLTVQQQPLGGETRVDPDLQETNFDIYVPDIFLYINGFTSIGSPDVNKISLYSLSTSQTIGVNPTLTFTLSLKSLTSTIFSVYGRTTESGKMINTNVRVVGRSSGAVLDVPVTITNY